MNDRDVFHIFEELTDCASTAELVAFVFAHPVVLSLEWQTRFVDFAKDVPEKKLANVAHALQSVDMMTRSLDQDLSKYHIGPGPVEKVYALIRNGEITEARGIELAAQPGVYGLLSLIYVRRLSIYAEAMARSDDWKSGLLIQTLVLAALDARRSQLGVDQEAMDFCAAVHWLDIVTRAVWDVPDGPLFRDAVARGEAFATTIQDPGGFYPPGEMLYRLGVLHLDPYVWQRNLADYQRQWRVWQDRLNQLWAAGYEGSKDDAARVPPVQEALHKAAEYLRRSAAVRKGTDRGLTLKALLQALISQQVAGVLPEPAEVRRLASEAKSLLPADRYATERAEIENLLAWNAREANEIYNKGIDLSEARTFLKKPISEWLKEQRPREVIELFTQTAKAVSDKDSRLALDLWLAALPVIVSEDDQIKESSFRQGIQFVTNALVPKAALRVRGKRITERAKAVDQMVKEENWDSRTRAAVLFSLAVSSTTSAEEAQGLELLQQGVEASPELATLLSPLLQWLKGVLQTGAAVNALDQGNAADAAQHYMMGAITFLDGYQPRIARDLILRTIDLGLSRDADALVPFVAGIGHVALDLENQLGDSTMISLQYYYRQVLARLVQQGANNALMLVFLLLAAKGNRFANALARRGRTPWLETEEAQRMLLSINDLLRTVSSEMSFSSMLDDEMLLTAYVSPQEMKGGATEVERLRNLQIHFDAELNRQLVTQPGSAPEWIPTIESLQETLGAQSVLLCYFVGTGPKMGGLAVYSLILTNQDLKLMVGESDLLPSATVTMSDGEEMIAGNLLSLDIKDLREALQLEPGPRTASGEALDGLAKDQGQYLGGGLPELLAHFRESGKDHLCIAPHGPLHYYPFHLLGPEGKPLSETWNVTYLPNLRLLDPSRKTPTTVPKLELTAIGLDFDTANPRGLPPLLGAEAEAAAIAKTFGTEPVTGATATKLAVLEAFANSKRIHLASHGEHRVSAPAFQCIYLAGCEGEDVLYSYELLRLDLHGVDLVTLSACETALGRFDVSDNLRGFSSSLLIAGVSTIIGTLWPIETNAAAFFFEQLYTALQHGSRKGHAFHRAQLETQCRFPQYRDWGAFYLAGAWL